jgi:transcriptional regulator with XRE-family HTH domain
MNQLSEHARRRVLGHFLRAQRERLTAADVGLPVGARRRTPGLRREEVAQLSNISVTWYIWIEQGRDVSVSAVALARLAVALQLTRPQRAYLFDLAARRDPEQFAPGSEAISVTVQACVDAIHSPAYILDRCWNARGWNQMAEHLFAGWLNSSDDKNLLRFIFLDPRAIRLIHGWDERAQRVVAEFRAQAGPHLNEPPLQSLIAELLAESQVFARFWHRHDVLEREGGERTFNHPTDGFLRYQQLAFNLIGQPDLKLTILVRSDQPVALPG